MSSKALCVASLDDAIAILEEMKAMLDEGGEDAPQGFLEAAQDAQERINRAVADALIPVLRLASARLVGEAEE